MILYLYLLIMNLPDKHTRIGLLMIISQILLMGFAFYWLNSQFDEEKEALVRDLAITYRASYNSVLDSMLVEQYIEPALGDTIRTYSGKSQSRIFVTDSFRLETPGDTVSGLGSTGNSIVKIRMNRNDTTGQFSEGEVEDLEKEMLLRSVRLIVQHVDDNSSMHISSLHKGMSDIDSLLFIADLESRIEDEALNIGIAWIGDSAETGAFVSSGNDILVGEWTDAVPSVSLVKYRAYLFGQILAQVIFALVLVLLTGSAFIIAFRSLRKQALLNEMRNSFISNISHELKTPVSTVKVAIEAIRNFDLKKDAIVADEYLEMAAKEIKRLELLISKVLDNTIIEQDASILRYEPVELSALIKAAIDSLAPKINEAKANVSFSPEKTAEIDADPMYLQGVIINLVDNSLKYGNSKPRVDIELRESADSYLIIVSDNGPGIPEKYADKIFEKFFRVPTSNIHNVKGYGLGLSFAALIIDLHGGEIGVINNETGCSFTIKLPRNS